MRIYLSFFLNMYKSTVYGLAFALLLLLAKRFQPLDKNSKHEAWFYRVFPLVITLVAAGGVAVSSCSYFVFVANGANIVSAPQLNKLQ